MLHDEHLVQNQSYESNKESGWRGVEVLPERRQQYFLDGQQSSSHDITYDKVDGPAVGGLADEVPVDLGDVLESG